MMAPRGDDAGLIGKAQAPHIKRRGYQITATCPIRDDCHLTQPQQDDDDLAP